MQWAARANEAYRQLRDPMLRARYLCEQAGVDLETESNTAMAPAFLMQQMEWREMLDEARHDPERLAHNEVPVAAAIYADDVYVESGLSLQTARVVRGMRPWLTNEYEHNGLRAAGDRVLGRLIDLAHGRA
jgi:DnaJ-domain-containing protein 1